MHITVLVSFYTYIYHSINFEAGHFNSQMFLVNDQDLHMDWQHILYLIEANVVMPTYIYIYIYATYITILLT